ncbi:MAG: hypothetical protein IH588_00905 [Anaerolineales bacterium]|nr:hypothetical protein [Anaerolineales bacterium]
MNKKEPLWKNNLVIRLLLFISVAGGILIVLADFEKNPGKILFATETPIPSATSWGQPIIVPTHTPTTDLFATSTTDSISTAPNLFSMETDGGTGIDVNRLRIGELKIEYPPSMKTFESETVSLQVLIPYEMANANLNEFDRVFLLQNEPLILEDYLTFSKFTYVYIYMRADLKSTSFEIEPLQGDGFQFVDIEHPGNPTIWEWIVQAPGYSGEQIIAASVYLGNSKNPSWVGSIKINVVSPTNTPAPTSTHTPIPPTLTATPSPTSTSTPVPVLARIGNQIIDSISLEVCLGIPAVILVVLTLMDRLRKRLKKKKQVVKKK